MKASVAAVFSIVLFAINTVAEKPKTVDEAVQVLKTKWLQPKDRDWILRNTKNEVWGRLYMGFGTGVRNQFGLWGDNQPLHDSCGSNDPERCSSVILNRLWESVRGDADPALVHQLDCQFQLAHAIHVSLKGFHQLTTREMIDDSNHRSTRNYRPLSHPAYRAAKDPRRWTSLASRTSVASL
jgi:hypothetical protein